MLYFNKYLKSINKTIRKNLQAVSLDLDFRLLNKLNFNKGLNIPIDHQNTSFGRLWTVLSLLGFISQPQLIKCSKKKHFVLLFGLINEVSLYKTDKNLFVLLVSNCFYFLTCSYNLDCYYKTTLLARNTNLLNVAVYFCVIVCLLLIKSL